MTAYDAGTAFLTIVPSFRGWDAAVTAKIRETSALLQKGIADALPAGFREGARSATPEGTKAGDEFGGAFARSVRARIEAALKALPKVELNADSTDADVKLAAIRAELEDLRTKRIGIDIDEALALAQLARLQAELDRLASESPSIAVRIDSARASEELAAVQAEVNHLDGQTANVHVKVDRDESGLGALGGLGGSGGGLGLLGFGVAASPLAVPLGGAALGGLAGAATVAGASGAGLGVLGLGLSGVTKAVQDLAAANTQAGGAATAAGAAQVRAALAVAAAERQVKASEDGLAQARANAADAAITAQERVQAALAAQAVAERNLTTAQQTQAQAQTALTEARKTAAQQLQDLSAQVTDGQLGLRQGQLDVTNARLNLQGVDSNPLSTQQQRQQAQLDYDQAVQHLKELQTQQGRLTDAQQTAAKKGVEGSDVVVQAQRNLAAATQAVTDAYSAQAAAEQGVSDARRQQAAQIRQSAYAIEQAQNSILSAQAALQSASLQSSTAGGALAQRVAVMSAPLKAFATFINDTLRPAFDKLRTAVQGALLPDLQAGLSSLLPVLPALTAFAVSLADTMGRLFIAASKALTSPFWQGFFTFVKNTAGPVLSTFAHIIGNIITGFAGLIQAFYPVTKSIGDGLLGLTKRFADFGTHLGSNSSFQAFLAYIRKEGPAVAHFFGDVASIIGKLITGLAPLGALMLDATNKVLDLIKQLGPGGLLFAIGAVATAVALLGGPVTAIVLAVTAFAGAVAYAYQHVKPFHDFVDNTLIPTLKKLADDALEGIHKGLKFITDAVGKNRKEFTQLGDVLHRIAGFVVQYILPLWGKELKLVFETIGFVIAGVITEIADLVDIFNTVKNSINDVVTFVKHLPARISAVTHGLWDGILTSFKSVINSIISIWNDLGFHITIPKSVFGLPVPGGGSTIGIDTPNIPLLRASGGPVVSGHPYWVGDGGTPELFVPGASGQILNLQQVAAAISGVSGGSVMNHTQLQHVGSTAGPSVGEYHQHFHRYPEESAAHAAMIGNQRLLHTLSNR